MKILSYNPGHDGAFAYLKDGVLVTSIEAEKGSRYRHSAVSIPDALRVLTELDEIPDVVCASGWWPGDGQKDQLEQVCGYYGFSEKDVVVVEQRLLGKPIKYFSSSHERSHLLCSFGMSGLAKGTPCYVLIWEGVIGAFYELDPKLGVKKLADVMPEPGHRYALLYGLADPTFDVCAAEFSRFSDAGKLMALASYSRRSEATDQEERIISFLMQETQHLRPRECAALRDLPHFNVGLDDTEFRNFVGIFSDRMFGRFFEFASRNLKRDMPLLIAGGCGLNCDWNSRWQESGLFSEVFVPPVANDSGSAIGTAVDAQFYFSGDPKIDWGVYSGLDFVEDDGFDASYYDEDEADFATVADMLARGLILGWVQGKYEIGPRALGNRSILAAPFETGTRTRLNEIKMREQFRPIAPVCLEEDAAKLFGCDRSSPFMLYTYRAATDVLSAVTHVNGTARLQTVTQESNDRLHGLLLAFRALSGFGVLCNTSLNFHGKGLINSLAELSAYAIERSLDGFVVGDRSFLLKSSLKYQEYKNA